MKKEFLESWRGKIADGISQTRWMKAQGSSLEEKELTALDAGCIVEHPKSGSSFTKIFARDEEGTLWSIIVHNKCLTSLKNDLKNEGGFLLPIA